MKPDERLLLYIIGGIVEVLLSCIVSAWMVKRFFM